MTERKTATKPKAKRLTKAQRDAKKAKDAAAAARLIDPNRKQVVEALIMEPIKEAAAAMAALQTRDLPSVAREVLIYQSRNLVKPDVPQDVAHPADRPAGMPRVRIRFRMPADEYEIVKARIRESGLSMTAAVEYGLEHYARTGEFR